jgi:hypothetical protein
MLRCGGAHQQYKGSRHLQTLIAAFQFAAIVQNKRRSLKSVEKRKKENITHHWYSLKKYTTE